MRLLFVLPTSWTAPPEAAESWWRAFWDQLRAREHEVEVGGRSSPDVSSWLADEVIRFDVVVFVECCSPSTSGGLPIVAGRVPTILHPLVDDGLPFRLPQFDTLVRLPTAYGFVGEAETALLRDRLGRCPGGVLVGSGFERAIPAETEAFRAASGVGDRPYLVARLLGSSRAAGRLSRFFSAYKERNPGPLALVVLGDGMPALMECCDAIVIEPRDQAHTAAAIAGAVCLVEPTRGATSAANLMVAGAQARPALVDGGSGALAASSEAASRQGVLVYAGYAEFEAAVDLLMADASLTDSLGHAGQQHVEAMCDWERVVPRYERMLIAIEGQR